MTSESSRNQLPEWKALAERVQSGKKQSLRALFQADPSRARRLSPRRLRASSSTTRRTSWTTRRSRCLLQPRERVRPARAHRRDVLGAEDQRRPSSARCCTWRCARRATSSIVVDGRNVVPDVHAVLDKMARVRGPRARRRLPGHTGKAIKNVVNLGIGGSDLGPVMAYEALRHYSQREPHVPLRLERRRHRLRGGRPRSRSRRDAVHRLLEDLHDTGNARQRPHGARLDCSSKLKDPRRSRSTSWRSPPTPPRCRSSASTRPTCSASGTGSAGATRSLPPIGLSLMLAIGPDALPRDARRLPRDGRALPDGAEFAQNLPVLLGVLGVWYNDFLRRRERRGAALRSVPGALPGVLCSSSTWRATASACTVGGSRDRLPDGPHRLGTARHQRAARVLPADPPGHEAHPLRLHRLQRTA